MEEQRITVAVPGHEYPILIGSGYFHDRQAPALAAMAAGRTCLLVTDSTVGPLYGDAAAALLAAAGAVRVGRAEIQAGEPSKTLETLAQLYGDAVRAGLDRRSLVAALGGGVVGDLAGFLAATYMRGVDFVQLPTSLVAQVDSAVGGKTGVDLPEGKNLVGAFKQPLAVLVDVAVLRTLPRRQLSCGLAEVVKYGVICDASLFAYLEAHIAQLMAADEPVYRVVVTRCCELKAAVAAADELDLAGRRAVLNYGHTFGHALEKLAEFEGLTHGEAVAVGMMMAAELAAARDASLADLVRRQESLLLALGLPVRARGWSPTAVLAAMQTDKKYEHGRARLVLPQRLGQAALVEDVATAAIRDAIGRRCDQ